MDKVHVIELHRQLYAALDNVQESYTMLKAGFFADDEICKDLLEQLASARSAVEVWESLIRTGCRTH